ncbi:MAG: 23S rRNA (uracil(1939)-C(5))-methyltransferase RlmD [Gammaproteobacteria bacterium]|nr:23S rRNA (uracil(1939)-C(5))-methyltransferase RlmD [Gammaproteobacteria bacterium]
MPRKPATNRASDGAPRQPKVFTEVIEDLSHDGRGVARIEGGKTVFVSGALPGETVTFVRRKKHRRFDEGEATEIENPSPDRVEPECPHFGVCGGCSLQHLAPAAQIDAKQKVLADNFERLGKVDPESWLEPLIADQWGYRRRARLGVKWVKKKGKVLVGFRERHAPFIAELESCKVIAPEIGEKLTDFGELIGALSIPDRIPQLEVSVAENATAVVVRHLDPLTEDDLSKLADFGREHGIRFYLQSKGPDTIVPLEPDADTPLRYSIPAESLAFEFLPSDFIQVNASLNNAMVAHALGLLELQGTESVLDLFCGLGNFTLPLARHAATVTGVEGDDGLVNRARDNARANGLGNVDFHVANLFEPIEDFEWARRQYDVLVLDPPRAGAEAVCHSVERFAADTILYVSCHPGSLARDAGILVNEKGYRLVKAGVMDMFPHTAHVESIALFRREVA